MSAYTTSQAGNWSNAATWGGGGVPGAGDTASLGHAVTVDVNTSVGTSPNDATTAVISFTANNVLLTLAAGVTLTVLGNIGLGNSGCGFVQGAGSSLVLDNSASGGSPVYTFTGVQIYKWTCSGTSGSPCAIAAISGQTFKLNQNFSVLNWAFTNVSRLGATSALKVYSSNKGYITDCVFDACAQVAISGTNGAYDFRRNTIQNPSGTDALKIAFTVASAAGARDFIGNCVLSGVSTYDGANHAANIYHNYFGGDFSCVDGSKWTQFRENMVDEAGSATNVMTDSIDRCYYVNTSSAGNPHFPSCKTATAMAITRSIFEAHTPDLVDTGDCISISGANVGAGVTVTAKNNIVLPNSYDGVSVSSGTLFTQYAVSVASLFAALHNTGNMDNSATAAGRRGMIAINEAGGASADTVPVLKSNLVWGSSADQGFLVERVIGVVQDIVTPTGADYNWRHNSPDGDQLRGYDDRANTGTDLWSAGDAVEAGVDVNQGTGDPQFVDAGRNVAKWAVTRGYGAQTFAAGIAAIVADPTRIPDLIDYVFAGFQPTNSAMRIAGHDGLPPGAATYYKSGRSVETIGSLAAYLSAAHTS